MLTYIDVSIENNPYRGGIEITSTAQTSTLGDVDAIKIYKRQVGGGLTWEEAQSIEVSSLDDLNFSLFDLATKSGKTYNYSIDVMSGTTIIETGLIEGIKCEFDGLFIGNENAQYFAGMNATCNANRKTQVEYVTTLSSKYPYAISNANTNYATGNASGLFLKLRDDKKAFLPDVDHTYSDKVVDFLTDGTYKVLKTSDGQAWYVSIGDTVEVPFHDRFIGMNSISFTWTEIGDLPVMGMVVDE